MIAFTSAHNDDCRYRLPYADGTSHITLPDSHFAVYWATSGARYQSIPINFISEDGVVFRPRQGQHYRAITSQHAGD
ncbi:MAG: hypothetical protein P8M18_03130 [Woeseiaceae bacterium]|nr:hypothetical protein [Woeseiaceae bacterium]